MLDLRLSRNMQMGNLRFEPIVDLFNVFNNNAVTNANTTIGSSLLRPSAIIMGRLLRVGGRIKF